MKEMSSAFDAFDGIHSSVGLSSLEVVLRATSLDRSPSDNKILSRILDSKGYNKWRKQLFSILRLDLASSATPS